MRTRNWEKKHAKAYRRWYYLDKRRKVHEIKNAPCTDCGKKFPYYVMQFDHREHSSKLGEIGRMVGDGYGWDKIKAEIDKCDLVCANCHAIRHHNRSQTTEK
jgi:5-methylcytosine-specific restriction endonuclease McrA